MFSKAYLQELTLDQRTLYTITRYRSIARRVVEASRGTEIVETSLQPKRSYCSLQRYRHRSILAGEEVLI